MINLDMTFSLYDLSGLCGVACSLYAYARVQWQRDFAKTISYSVFNAMSCVLMFISLSHQWNLASFVSNCVWLVLSIYGIYRCLKYIHRHNVAKTEGE